ncbi:MAG: glycosyltransferase family 2 protein, partial [Gammaproteobacteria bacterium]
MSREASRLSVVVPVFNEEENVGPLADAVRVSLSAAPGLAGGWELVLVNDGSTDGTGRAIERLAAADPRIRLVQLRRHAGQTAAMMAGFAHARGDVIATMDGDLQNDPRDLPAMVAKLDEGFDLVAGWRVRRQDRLWTRKVPSWIANRLIARITGIPIRDNGCSLKVYRRALLERITLYADMHRFIPAFAALAGARIAQLPVRHHARRFGRSKYGLGRTYRVLADLV